MKQRRLFPDTDKQDPTTGPYWQDLRDLRHTSSADDLRERLDSLSPSNRNRMKNEMSISRPLRFLSARAAILILGLVGAVTACMVPVETTEPVGKVVSFRIPAGGESTVQAIKARFGRQASSIVDQQQADGSHQLTVSLPGMSEKHLDEAMAQLQAERGTQSAKVSTLSATVRQSIASQLLYNTFHTHINATELSDDELKASIEAQLAQNDLTGFQVTIVHLDNGARAFRIVPPAGRSDNFSVDVTVDDGEHSKIREVIRSSNGEIGSSPDMDALSTDAGIREMVKKNHPDLNLTDDDIQIERNGDEANVTINKDGRQMKLKLITKEERQQSH